MHPSYKKRALHRLHGTTQARKHPKTGEREFLLHRGVNADEYSEKDKGKHFHVGESVSWTPHKHVAKYFANEYSDEGGGKGKVISAWVPESKIKHIPKSIGIGHSDVGAGIKDEHEVITHDNFKAEKHEA